MLPVVAGEASTRRHILLYTLILVPLGVAPWVFGFAGRLYGLTAAVTGAIMLALACHVFGERQPAERAAGSCLRSRSSICFCCLPCCWSSAGGAG